MKLTIKSIESEFHEWDTVSVEDQRIIKGRLMITESGITIAKKRKLEAPESRIVCSRLSSKFKGP